MAAPLRADLLAKAEELPVPGAGGPPAPAPTAAPMTAAGVGEGGEKAEPAKAGGGKMPKWFKGPGSEFPLPHGSASPMLVTWLRTFR